MFWVFWRGVKVAKGHFLHRPGCCSGTLTFETFCNLFTSRACLFRSQEKLLIYRQSINQAGNVSEFSYFGVQGTAAHLFFLLLHLLLRGAGAA